MLNINIRYLQSFIIINLYNPGA